MKDARFSLNSKAVFRPTQNGAVIATGIQTVDQLKPNKMAIKIRIFPSVFLVGQFAPFCIRSPLAAKAI